jgi:DoxX-like family
MPQSIHLFRLSPMSTASAVVTIVLAAILAFAAIRKLTHREDVVATYAKVGVPENRLNQLAFILLLGAAGLLLGFVWASIGVAAAVGVVVYFVLAIAAHVRHDDTGNLPTPVAIEAVAVTALLLQALG